MNLTAYFGLGENIEKRPQVVHYLTIKWPTYDSKNSCYFDKLMNSVSSFMIRGSLLVILNPLIIALKNPFIQQYFSGVNSLEGSDILLFEASFLIGLSKYVVRSDLLFDV